MNLLPHELFYLSGMQLKSKQSTWLCYVYVTLKTALLNEKGTFPF